MSRSKSYLRSVSCFAPQARVVIEVLCKSVATAVDGGNIHSIELQLPNVDSTTCLMPFPVHDIDLSR